MPGRILIVEDIATNRMILRSRLSQAYYDVIEAEDGLQAIEMAGREEPDLILLDVMMPGIDGFEVCRRLKSDPATLHIPIVMLTALDKRDDRMKGLEAGADDFLSKPFEDIALMSRVASLTRMKMMVDELALRGETSSGIGVSEMIETARATVFPDSTVLVVSSSETAARRVREFLHQEIKCRVEIATSIEEAEALIEFLAFDAIMIDDLLDGGDPLRLGAMVRARPETRQSATLLVVAEKNIELATKALELGFNDYIESPVDVIELVARVRSQLRRKHYADQLRANMRATMVQAVTDPLTGTYNRRYASNHLDALVERCRENGSDLAILMLDLDHFKSVNDTHGHAAGDAVLREFARRLQHNVRGMDLVARMGGEEFMVIMPDVHPDLAAEIAERIRTAIASPAFTVAEDGTKIDITVSIGYAVLHTKETVFELIKRADVALYQSKDSGRNRVTVAQAA